MSRSPLILLVEDNPDDVSLTLRAFERSQVPTDIVVTHDGEEALDFLFATGRYAERDVLVMPEVVLLDLKLPKD
jgi:two-component system response regulator